MLVFLLLFGLALGAVPPSQVRLERGSCPLSWYSFSNRCYKYVDTLLTWLDAELHCVSLGSNLVSVHSQEEEDFVKALIKNFDQAERRTWIGLSDVHKEGTWLWSDGSAVDFVFWNEGEPNNVAGNENCVLRNYGSYRKWNDGQCSATWASVCASR